MTIDSDEGIERPGSPGSPRRRRSWFEAARWFGAEFLVVLSGVLVALALNAAYSQRVDARREAAYLEQLTADLLESETVLEQALADNAAEREKLMQLLTLFVRPEPPTNDEFDELKILSIAAAQPTLSTAQAVVRTGDLQLIDDDSLRNAIIQYVGAGEAYYEVQDAVAREWLTSSIRDYYAIVRPGAGPNHPFKVLPGEALSRRELFDVAYDLQLGYSNFIRLQRRMLERVRNIQAEVVRVRAES
jgi:hypothetical protein